MICQEHIIAGAFMYLITEFEIYKVKPDNMTKSYWQTYNKKWYILTYHSKINRSNIYKNADVED